MVFLKVTVFSILIILIFVFIGSRIPQTTSGQVEVIPTGEVLTLEDFIVAGEQIYYGKGTCTLCHDIGQKGKRAPDLAGIGKKAETKREGLSAYDYLKESLVEPAAYTVEGYEEGLMPVISAPPVLLSEGEIEAVIGFLQSLDGEVTVTPMPLGEAGEEPEKEIPLEDIFAGDELFDKMGCNGCHFEGGEGPVLSHFGKDKDIEEVERILLQHKPSPVYGRMTEDYGEELKAKEFQHLVAFLKYRYVLGEKLISKYICLSCHLIEGEGKSIGPDLTHEGDKVNPDWLSNFLMNPYKIRPSEASPDSMTNLGWTEKEVEYLSTYILSLRSPVTLPDFDTSITENEIKSGERLLNQKYGCLSCHIINDTGGVIGPSLDRVGTRLNSDWLYTWLKNPQQHIPETIMPNFGMSERDARELTAYLISLQ
jgi:cytochrome c2